MIENRVRFFGRIQKRICDLRSFGSWCIKGTVESTLDEDSSVPLMHYDPNDLRLQIRFWILPKKRTPNFGNKNYVLILGFIVRFKVTRKWPIKFRKTISLVEKMGRVLQTNDRAS